MKTTQTLILVAAVALFTDCATVTPKELTNARMAYQDASEGKAPQLVPAELHKAQEALALAEKSFKKDPDSYKTRDLAYVAQRKAELAGALATMAENKATKSKADGDFQKQQGEIIKEGKQDLSAAEKQRVDAQTEVARLAASKQVDAELQKRQDDKIREGQQELGESEKRTAAALADLAKLAAVKEQQRGLVVTLSGSVLFRSGQSKLMPSAEGKLDEVARALREVHGRNLIVEGYTDALGSEEYNQGLSQRRADAVRDYIVNGGYPSDSIRALGKGESSPIADNTSAEGRANNRRVEIIIERAPR